jgi:MoaA/NifB/PqqE/SkfB family radical SAM enzyme
MSEDFFEILASVDTKKSITTLFTNGYFLEENIERLNKL